MASRNLADLHPAVHLRAQRGLDLCQQAGIEVLVTCTYRSAIEQDALYAQGRTTPGRIVTQVKGGLSLHNWRCAFDFVPIKHGKPVWGTQGEDGKLWQECGRLFVFAGLEWGGNWSGFRDMPHCQYTGGLTLGQIRGGAIPT